MHPPGAAVVERCAAAGAAPTPAAAQHALPHLALPGGGIALQQALQRLVLLFLHQRRCGPLAVQLAAKLVSCCRCRSRRRWCGRCRGRRRDRAAGRAGQRLEACSGGALDKHQGVAWQHLGLVHVLLVGARVEQRQLCCALGTQPALERDEPLDVAHLDHGAVKGHRVLRHRILEAVAHLAGHAASCGLRPWWCRRLHAAACRADAALMRASRQLKRLGCNRLGCLATPQGL